MTTLTAPSAPRNRPDIGLTATRDGCMSNSSRPRVGSASPRFSRRGEAARKGYLGLEASGDWYLAQEETLREALLNVAKGKCRDIGASYLDVDDIVSDRFNWLWKRWQDPRSYLERIAHRECVELWRTANPGVPVPKVPSQRLGDWEQGRGTGSSFEVWFDVVCSELGGDLLSFVERRLEARGQSADEAPRAVKRILGRLQFIGERTFAYMHGAVEDACQKAKDGDYPGDPPDPEEIEDDDDGSGRAEAMDRARARIARFELLRACGATQEWALYSLKRLAGADWPQIISWIANEADRRASTSGDPPVARPVTATELIGTLGVNAFLDSVREDPLRLLDDKDIEELNGFTLDNLKTRLSRGHGKREWKIGLRRQHAILTSFEIGGSEMSQAFIERVDPETYRLWEAQFVRYQPIEALAQAEERAPDELGQALISYASTFLSFVEETWGPIDG